MYKKLSNKYGKNTLKLALTYLAIIMAMSLSFSFVLYSTSVNQLRKPLPPNRSNRDNIMAGRAGYNEPFNDEVRELLNNRFQEAKEELLLRLLFMNLLILAGGALFSFYLARRTLDPIEQAMEAQSRFVSDASHEVRTPLTVLQTTNEVALRKKNLNESESRKILRQNIQEVEKLKSLSDSLLDLLKNENLAIKLQQISLKEAAIEAVELVEPSAVKKQIKIINKIKNRTVNSDYKAVVRILTILLDNTVKYSPEATKVFIDSTQKDGHTELSVSDAGLGIQESALPHIFDRFYRADDARQKNEEISGYGLGLSIAKQTAENINAKITAASRIGKGSVFTIIFPK